MNTDPTPTPELPEDAPSELEPGLEEGAVLENPADASPGPRRAVLLPDLTGHELATVERVASDRGWDLHLTPVAPVEKGQVDGLIVGQSPAPGHPQLDGSPLLISVVDRRGAKAPRRRGLIFFLVAMLVVATSGLLYAVLSHQDLLTAKKEAAAKVSDMSVRLEASNAEVASLEAEVAEAKAELARIGTELAAATSDLASSESEVADLLASLEAAHAEVELLTSRLALAEGTADLLPDLLGLSRAELLSAAEDHGWQVVVFSEEGTSLDAQVTSQVPAAGTPVASGSVVVVTFGPDPVTDEG